MLIHKIEIKMKTQNIQLENTKKEIFKDIAGYEGLYQVSNFGRVKSLKNIVKYKNNKIYIYKERILNLEECKNGYLRINLQKNKKRKHYLLHRLIAQTFIPNPKNKPTVNHINGIKSDNRIENLEWNTRSENTKHAFRIGLMKPYWLGKFGKDIPLSKPVLQYTLNGELIKEWENAKFVERQIGIPSSSICRCCNGIAKTVHNFKWKYKN